MGTCASSTRRVSSAFPSMGRELSARVSSFRVPSLRYLKKRRLSVSAEAGRGLMRRHGGATKDDKTKQRILAIMEDIPVFRELDEDQRMLVVEAMEARSSSPGDIIIQEGEEGDFFYAIESGVFVATVREKILFKYDNSGSFGELALMYNAPRAATIKAETSGRLWALDRTTFRALVINTTRQRRENYEGVLRDNPVFCELEKEELAAVADALAPESFKEGTLIISQGDAATSNSKLYMIERGAVDCYRTDPSGKRTLAAKLGPGDVFGEIALLTDSYRQADCVATSEVRCLTLQRDAFERLMGPCQPRLKKRIETYASADSRQQE